MHGGVYSQDTAYPWYKKLKCYACQRDIAILYHYPAENLNFIPIILL